MSIETRLNVLEKQQAKLDSQNETVFMFAEPNSSREQTIANYEEVHGKISPLAKIIIFAWLESTENNI